MTEDGELDSEVSKIILDEFEKIVAEQQYLYKNLSVDFSNIFAKYSDYIFDDMERIADSLLDQADKESDINNIEDLDDMDGLEEL